MHIHLHLNIQECVRLGICRVHMHIHINTHIMPTYTSTHAYRWRKHGLLRHPAIRYQHAAWAQGTHQTGGRLAANTIQSERWAPCCLNTIFLPCPIVQKSQRQRVYMRGRKHQHTWERGPPCTHPPRPASKRYNVKSQKPQFPIHPRTDQTIRVSEYSNPMVFSP